LFEVYDVCLVNFDFMFECCLLVIDVGELLVEFLYGIVMCEVVLCMVEWFDLFDDVVVEDVLIEVWVVD